ncbi:MAG: ABC transporter permease [Coriobacteriales bacterium]|nr:ABC transporter permease [Coriobacteriales bacterium]
MAPGMLRYLAGRLAQALAVMLAVAALAFVIFNVVPGDPVRAMLGDQAQEEAVEQLRHQMGLDLPLAEQFARWIGGLLRGDLGTSYTQRRPVSELLALSVGHTLRLAAGAFALALVLGVVMGVVAALCQGRWPDRAIMALAVTGISTPAFWFAIALQLVFSLWLGWLPLSGVASPAALVLPTLALGCRQAAAIARVTRTALLEQKGLDYLQTAVAKGLGRRQALLRHGLRNALVPIVAICGSQLGDVLGGSVIVETIFGIPGIGSLLVRAIGQRDLPLIEGCVLYVAFVCVLAYLASDLLYALVDPRVRLGDGVTR